MNVRSNTIRQLFGWALALALSGAGNAAWADDAGGTVDVKLGETIKRTWDDVKKADYAYGPKQEFDAAKKETHLWLPYGTKGVYFETVGVAVSDPEPGKPAMMMNGVDGFTCVRWGYKLHFDKPISGFRFSCSLAELGLENAVAGVEYSTDGQKWTTLKEVEKGGTVNAFVKADEAKADGLKAEDLYLRFYSRKKGEPDAERADSAWFKLWTAGDPSWGDASATFFNIQMQVWITAAE